MILFWLACNNVEKKTDTESVDDTTINDTDETDSGVASDTADTTADDTEDTATEESDTEETEEELPAEECDDAYLLELDFQSSTPAQIWQYDLSTLSITDLGPLECPMNQSGDLLVAMTADSKGFLWLSSMYGDIYRAVPATMECQFMNINANISGQGFVAEGLAFMKDDPLSNDILYISGVMANSVNQEAAIAVQNGNAFNVLFSLSNIVYPNHIIDIAGTADGRLFGLRPLNGNSELMEIDMNSGTITRQWELAVAAPQGWSSVALTGQHWLFTSSNATTT
ncbi:MAG: hypothetical protein VX278_13500, partial [Myxococcota bacterium]|nr:hypothetical protein [Myxococcota bacterium]